MPLKYILSIFILLFGLTNLFSQNDCLSDYGSRSNNLFIVNKKGKEYKIKVTLPPNYDGKISYKTIYYLDSWWLSETVLGSNALLDLSNTIEPLIFVGISIHGNESEWHKQRNFDYTQSKYSKNKMGYSMEAGGVKLDSINSGGGNEFMDFLIGKIIPTIENKFPSRENENGFIGHSFGGLFGLFLLQKHPQLFKDYILISPSLWWNKNELITKSNLDNLSSNKDLRLFISFGTNESKLIKKSILKFDKLVTESNTNFINYSLKQYEGCNHNSVVPRAIYDGLELFYSLE